MLVWCVTRKTSKVTVVQAEDGVCKFLDHFGGNFKHFLRAFPDANFVEYMNQIYAEVMRGSREDEPITSVSILADEILREVKKMDLVDQQNAEKAKLHAEELAAAQSMLQMQSDSNLSMQDNIEDDPDYEPAGKKKKGT